MVSTDKLIGDVVGVIIEKVLMDISVTMHSKMIGILGDYNMTFSDCYRKPDVLNFALKEIFGNAYMAPVEKMRNELMGLDEDEKVNAFLELIGES